MSDINIDSLLEPITDDAVCGEDLEYDAEFLELERIALGKEAKVMGDTEIPAEPPDWREVYDQSSALMARTKDLRVASHLAHSNLNLHGLPGLASGLELISRLLQQYWDEVHPQLDAEDDNDPTLRINSLMQLNSTDGFVGDVERAVLASSKALGRFSLRDIRLASGEITRREGDDTEIPDPTHIDAAFMDCELDELTDNAEAIAACLATLDEMSAFTSDKVGASYAPDLANLTTRLKSISGVVNEHLGKRGVDVEAEPGEDGAAAAAPAAGVPGEIRSREDAIRALEKVSEYFRKNEPSSPVPMLLQRAKRLISMDFMEILRDLTPQGVSEAEMIAGMDRDD
jgi:type VI secretion system protein ImpA